MKQEDFEDIPLPNLYKEPKEQSVVKNVGTPSKGLSFGEYSFLASLPGPSRRTDDPDFNPNLCDEESDDTCTDEDDSVSKNIVLRKTFKSNGS